MRIAVEGCSHGELDIIYNSITRLEKLHNFKIDLLLCCGDFQAVRNEQDLKCMAVPLKYMAMQDFYKYYCGEKTAPVLTIFIGGNHEASNYLQELPYGGWVAPNIYYLGYAGVLNIAGVRIGGLSGIYKGPDYLKGHFEKPPYSGDSVRSVYHVRNLEVFRLKQLSGDVDIFLSHDWPRGVYNYGNKAKLIETKFHFKDEINRNDLGSRPAEDLLKKIQPSYWFSGHLHVKFAAIVKHDAKENGQKITKFLALDKCLPRREFLQVLEIPHDEHMDIKLQYDLEWLTILRLTNHLISTQNQRVYMPGPGSDERFNFMPTKDEKQETLNMMKCDLNVSLNFAVTAACFDDSKKLPNMVTVEMPNTIFNPQTVSFCEVLQIDDPLMMILGSTKNSVYKDRNVDIGFNESELNVTEDSSKLSAINDEPTAVAEHEISTDIVDLKSPDGASQKVSLSPLCTSSPCVFESPSSRRYSLILSQPKSSSASANDDSLSVSSLSECASNQSSPVKNLQEKRQSDDESYIPLDSLGKDPSNLSSSKKIKRRNQVLYTFTDDST